MVGFLLGASLLLAVPDVEVTAPDSVGVGETFAVEIRITGTELRNVSCLPESSGGLDFLGSGSLGSFSSVTTPTGIRMVSETILTLTFSAPEAGRYEVGPFSLTAGGTGRMELPSVTVIAAGAGRRGRTRPSSELRFPGLDGLPSDGPAAWIEVKVDTSETVYPACPFEATYFLCTTRSDLVGINYGVEGCAHAASRTLENASELAWRRGQDGVKRAMLARLEITPAFPCSLVIPGIGGVVTLRSGPIETEYDLPGDSIWIPVMPFPEGGRPANFAGAVDSLSVALSRVPGGYSMAAERCFELTATGPGAPTLAEPPPLTVGGPASLRFGPREEQPGGVRWLVLLQPSDSGTVILGPDSVAWFDRGEEAYRQAEIPPCTLTVRAPVRSGALPEIDAGPSDGDGILAWAVLAAVLSAIVLLAVRSARKRVSWRPIAEARDPEELLTAMEREISGLLDGAPSSMGFEELNEALDDVGADNILQRRLMRFWKDLELQLSGRAPSPGHLEELRRTASELVDQLAAELRRLRS